jgi:uncharacterized protein (TIGR02246 family)
MKFSLSLASLFAVSATGLLLAQDTPRQKATTTRPTTPAPAAGTNKAAPAPTLPPTVSAEDVKGVQAAVDAFVKAFNNGDVKAVTALFTENAEVTYEDGAMAVGKPAISAQYEAIFQEHPGRKLSVTTEAIRFFADDVAQEEGRAILTPADGGPAEHSRYSVVYVKKDGRWLQATVRDDHDEAVRPHERLKPLEWMVGDWVNQTGSLVTSTTCHWSPDKNYLLRDFTVKHEGKAQLSGTQRIGWDPLTKHIKSWVFDSEGGYGEGLWSHEGGHWVVKATGVLPDGKTASATHHIEVDTKDRVRWLSVDRVVAGKPIAETEEIVLVRTPPQAPSTSGSPTTKSSR